MEDESVEPEPLEGENALRLFREGVVDWNKWARRNSGARVDFRGINFSAESTSFAEFLFPGDTYFNETRFLNGDFQRSIFQGDVYFDHAVFKSDFISFLEAEFRSGIVYFREADFDCREANFTGTKFYGHGAIFREAVFKNCVVKFKNAEFSKSKADFARVTFHGSTADFYRCRFNGDGANFSRAKFESNVKFEKATFLNGRARFEGGRFEAAANFEKTEFEFVPDFRRTKLSSHFTLHEMKVFYSEIMRPHFPYFKMAENETDADRLRRLKELAVVAKDHDREQYFFALELKAKRFHETRGAALVWSYLYEWCSDFGRSTGIPLVWLALTWFLFGIWFAELSGNPGMGPDGWAFSAANLVPFLGGAKGVFTEAKTALFGASMGAFVGFLTLVEGLISVVFLFLTGLALRNRFRI